jgi:hypothetical protein
MIEKGKNGEELKPSTPLKSPLKFLLYRILDGGAGGI